jgi:ferredoxin
MDVTRRLSAFVDRDVCIGSAICVKTAPKPVALNRDLQAEVIGRDVDWSNDAVDAAYDCPVGPISATRVSGEDRPGHSTNEGKGMSGVAGTAIAPAERRVPRLAFDGGTKSFGTIHAVEDVPIALYGGEVHTLLGETGAAKPTDLTATAGLHRRDGGRLLLDGRERRLAGLPDARAAGIAVICQEPTLLALRNRHGPVRPTRAALGLRQQQPRHLQLLIARGSTERSAAPVASSAG